MDIGGFDPFAAATGRTINSVFGGVLLIFLIPFHLKAEVEKLLDVFEGNMIVGAAFGGHMLRVTDGECKDAAKTGVAHTVRTRQFCRFRDRNVGETG